MEASVLPSIINPLLVATPLRSPLHPALIPKLKSAFCFPRLPTSPSLTAINHSHLLHASSSRTALNILHRFCSSPLACVLKNDRAEPEPRDTAKDEAMLARGESTMPERFRHFLKEVPESPTRWPWAVVLLFLAYAWRAVLSELSNWKKLVFAMMKPALMFISQCFSFQITCFIVCAELVFEPIRYVYGNIISFALVPELTETILFASTVLAIAEATVPDSVNGQPYLLTLSGILVYVVIIMDSFPDQLIWMTLFGMFIYSKFIRRRDNVSTALPLAAMFAAVGKPWVRGIVISFYLALAICQHAKCPNGVQAEVPKTSRRPPLPLFLAALAIGINCASKWIHNRHLTWMLV